LKIATVLTDAQKSQVADFKADFKKHQTAAAAGRGAAPKAGNTLFRATRYALNHPAFAGRTLTPGKTPVEVQRDLEKAQPEKDTKSPKLKPVDASRCRERPRRAGIGPPALSRRPAPAERPAGDLSPFPRGTPG